MTLDYEKEIEYIDESALDVEWLNQPHLTIKYGRHAANVYKETESAKKEIELVRADLDVEIRANPGTFGLDKITESAINNIIVRQSKFQKAQTRYIEAKFEADLAKYAMQAIEDRKTALENLVRLHGQQYFAGPKVPRDLSKEWQNKYRQESTDDKVSKKMKRGKPHAEEEG